MVTDPIAVQLGQNYSPNWGPFVRLLCTTTTTPNTVVDVVVVVVDDCLLLFFAAGFFVGRGEDDFFFFTLLTVTDSSWCCSWPRGAAVGADILVTRKSLTNLLLVCVVFLTGMTPLRGGGAAVLGFENL